MPGLVLGLGLIMAAACGRHLNPEWCAEPGHTDPSCPGAIDVIDAASAPCTTDEDCPGAACLPGGACALPGTVLFASPTGTGAACTSAARCALATALDQVTGDRDIISLAPGSYAGAISISHSVRILGKSAMLVGASTGAAVTVTGGAAVELDDLMITGASGGSGIACTSGTLIVHAAQIVKNQQGITSACVLTVERSTLGGNTDGALAITAGEIKIRNNFIGNNGNPMLARSANVVIAAGVTGSFRFNTVAYNDAKQTSTPGVDCAATGVTADGNLVTDNTHKGAFNVDPQVTGVCDFSRSYTAPGAGGNDLHWANVALTDFHLTAASLLALDRLPPDCASLDDFDGQSRPMGSGCDFGADERAP